MTAGGEYVGRHARQARTYLAELFDRQGQRVPVLVPVREMSSARARRDLLVELAREQRAGLVEDVDDGGIPYSDIKLTVNPQPWERRAPRRRPGLFGWALSELPVEVAALVWQVARLLDVEPESQWLFVKDGAGEGLPGGFVLACEGVVQPFSWWMATAELDGRLTVPAGWRLEAMQDSPAVMGIVPA
ncbi:hypothetical protein AB0F93_00400 [Micromonospora tulbaghiae]|uniref:hypothetical protein n=1 Tax=Micromonospora tulbaghiae TaxID=479978 RepID=UPI00332A6464